MDGRKLLQVVWFAHTPPQSVPAEARGGQPPPVELCLSLGHQQTMRSSPFETWPSPTGHHDALLRCPVLEPILHTRPCQSEGVSEGASRRCFPARPRPCRPHGGRQRSSILAPSPHKLLLQCLSLQKIPFGILCFLPLPLLFVSNAGISCPPTCHLTTSPSPGPYLCQEVTTSHAVQRRQRASSTMLPCSGYTRLLMRPQPDSSCSSRPQVNSCPLRSR